MARTKKTRERNRATSKIPNHATRRRWITGAILAIGIAAGVVTWQQPGIVWGYKKAPSFTLQSSTTRVVSLEDFRGKNDVVLIFYMGAG